MLNYTKRPIIKANRRILLGLIVITLFLCGQVGWIQHRSYVTSRHRRPYIGCELNWRESHLLRSVYEPSSKDINCTKQHIDFPIYKRTTISLNTSRYLLPILANGPNNQLIGLREAVVVAVRLNRTLVVPKFFKHFSDRQTNKGWDVHPGHRVEVKTLCTFVPCIGINQFREICGNRQTVIFNLKNYKGNSYRHFTELAGHKTSGSRRLDKNLIKNMKLIPPEPLKEGEKFRKFHEKDVAKMFRTDEACALYPRPLYNLKGIRLKQLRTEKDHGEDTDINGPPINILYRQIIENTQNPEYVIDLAKDFISTFSDGKPYITVHWRYNKNDFMRRCKPTGEEKNKIKDKICREAMFIKPTDIALAIATRLTHLENLKYDIKNVYIASPSSERHVVSQAARILYLMDEWKVTASSDLERYFKENLMSCDFMDNLFDDILSTTEMEICARGIVFLSSQRSSWSSNVHLIRSTISHKEVILPQKDCDIFSLSSKMIKLRPSSTIPIDLDIL